MRWDISPMLLLVALMMPRLPAQAKGPKTDLVVVVNESRNVEGLTLAVLRDLFLKRRGAFPNGDRAVVIAWAAQTPPRIAFDRALLRMTPAQSAQYWLQRRIRGGGNPPRSLNSGSLIHRLLTRRSEIIAYLPAEQLKPGVRAIARIWQDASGYHVDRLSGDGR